MAPTAVDGFPGELEKTGTFLPLNHGGLNTAAFGTVENGTPGKGTVASGCLEQDEEPANAIAASCDIEHDGTENGIGLQMVSFSLHDEMWTLTSLYVDRKTS